MCCVNMFTPALPGVGEGVKCLSCRPLWSAMQFESSAIKSKVCPDPPPKIWSTNNQQAFESIASDFRSTRDGESAGLSLDEIYDRCRLIYRVNVTSKIDFNTVTSLGYRAAESTHAFKKGKLSTCAAILTFRMFSGNDFRAFKRAHASLTTIAHCCSLAVQ